MNQIVNNIFRAIDSSWIKRKRIMDTMTIVTAVHQSAVHRRGLNHILQIQHAPFSAAALCKARQKLPQGCFRKALCEATYVNEPGRVFAVDGSKVHPPFSFISKGFTTRTNDQPVSRPAKRPLAMLSSIVDVRSKACVDFVLTNHFNERKAFSSMLCSNFKSRRYLCI